MNCPFCHYPVKEHESSVMVGEQRAHAACVEHDAERQSRPFRERVNLDDRGEDQSHPLKERRSERELHE